MTKSIVSFVLIVGTILSVPPRNSHAQDEGYYLYALAADSAGEIEPRRNYTTSMAFEDRLDTFDVSVTFEFSVANPSEKIILDVDELVVVDFTATLEEDTSGVEHGYEFTVHGFEIVDISEEINDFVNVGDSFSGQATLKYTGSELGGGKHWFKLSVTGPIISMAEMSEMWCSDIPWPDFMLSHSIRVDIT